MKKLMTILLGVFLFFTLTSEDGCMETPAVSTSGITKATTQVNTGLDGLTIEQRNVIERLKEDNKPGSIKHLYIMSAYSGDVLIYSTVKGKVTSSGKRLSPSRADNGTIGDFKIDMGNGTYTRTNEILSDDGTYGSSVEYIYWWDSKNIYHMQFITGGMILHISNQPMAIKKVILNMEETSSSSNYKSQPDSLK